MKHKNYAAVFIPTYNGGDDLNRLLNSLKESQSESNFDIVIIDSSSSDNTVKVAKKYTNKVTVIDKSNFDHGGTRQYLVDNNDYEICIFMTQDAYLASTKSITEILKPFDDPRVGAVCGRQLPHKNANPLAQHARYFNYPDTYFVKTIDDKEKFGIKTAFVSNSFTAYRRSALLDVGGFPSKLILSEDMYAAAKMIMKGWRLVYNNKALCYHSHNYTLIQEFKRYFDIGVFHHDQPWINKTFGNAGGEGYRYVKSEINFLKKDYKLLLPLSFITCALKLIGYKSGKMYNIFPTCMIKKMSMTSNFWSKNKNM